MIRHLKTKFRFFQKRFSSNKENLFYLGTEGTFAQAMKANKHLVADKTILIQELVKQRCNYLITRPRRMGKTFNLSMLNCFFDQDETEAPNIFKETFIGSNKEIIEKHMNKYPVISLSLKGHLFAKKIFEFFF